MRRAAWLFALALGCGEAPAPGDASPAAAASIQGDAADPSLPPAPSLDRYGLLLNSARDADIRAWLDARGLDCKSGPALARTTYQYRCQGELPLTLLPDRIIRGHLAELLLARLDDGPLHHFSTLRKYSIPVDAAEDYDRALERLSAELGPPARSTTLDDPERLRGKAARFASTWRFSDLEVSLSVLKAAGDFVSVNEVWRVPGAEALAGSRGGGAHGAGGKPAGWNPHVIDPAPPTGASTTAP